MSTTTSTDLPAVPTAGYPVGTWCKRRSGLVCRIAGHDEEAGWTYFNDGFLVWSGTGIHTKTGMTPRDIVAVYDSEPVFMPTGWTLAGSGGLVCGDEVAVKRFPDNTVLCAEDDGSRVLGFGASWCDSLDHCNTLTANMFAVDAAWEQHNTPEPVAVLEWSKSEFFWESERAGWSYLVGSQETFHHANPSYTAFAKQGGCMKWLSPAEGLPSVNEAMLACERHARGE